MQPSNEAPHNLSECESLLGALAGSYLRLSRLLDRRMAAQGASLAQTRVLMLVQKTGSARAADIAELFGLAPRTVTDSLDGLERAGLIFRQPHPKDRRVKEIHITPQGRRAVAETEPLRLELINAVFAALTEEDRDDLSRILDKITVAIAAEEARNGMVFPNIKE